MSYDRANENKLSPFSGVLELWSIEINSGCCSGKIFSVAVAWVPCYREFMIVSFNDKGSEDIFNGKNTKEARKVCPRSLWTNATRKLDQLDSVIFIEELRVPPGNMLEALKGNRKGQYSIRINNQYRVCFKWSEKGPDDVAITDYH